MTYEEKLTIEISPLSGPLTSEGVTVDAQIYRTAGSNDRWTLKVIDEQNAATVWDDTFATERDAYAEFYRTIESDGAGSFSDKPIVGPKD